MLKKIVHIVLIVIFITSNMSSYGSSELDMDTALAMKYNKSILKYEKINKDTLEMFLDSLEKLRDNSKYHMVKGICQTTLGYHYFFNSDYDSAISYYKQSKKYFLSQMDTVYYLKLLNLIGNCYNYKRDSENAIKQFKEAIKILASKPNPLMLSKSYFYLSNSYSAMGNYKIGLRYLMLADSVSKENNIIDNIAYIYNSMAIMYSKCGDIEKSKQKYFNAISIAKNSNDNYILASIYLNLGDLYDRNYSNYDSASYFMEKSLKISEQYNYTNIIPYLYNNLSDVYCGQKRYYDCINLVSSNLSSDISIIKSAAWINVGVAYYWLENYDSARYYLTNVITIATKVEEKENLSIAYKTLYLIDSTNRDYESALKNYIQYKNITDEINSDELKLALVKNEERIAVLNHKKEKDFWENEAIIAKKLNFKTKIINILLVISLVFAILILIIVNINRRKNKKHHDELILLNDTLIANKELLESNNTELANHVNTKNTLLSIISHDLRSPIGTSKQLLEVIQENFDTFDKDELKDIINTLLETVDRVNDLLNNLLNWSRVEQGRLEPKFEVFELRGAINSYLNQVADVAKNKEIDIEVNIEADVDIKSDHNFLSTIIRNLISNAIKFSPRASKVIIEGKYYDDSYLLSITDHGEGMKPELVQNIFNVDSKASNLGTEDEKGSGFGLKLVKSMADKLGAEITIESKIGQGSVFCIKLPCGK